MPSHLDRYVIGLGSTQDPKRLALQTKCRWDIPNAPLLARSPAEMKTAYAIHKKEHLTLRLRSMRSEYNCVGLVFGSRRTAVDIEDVLKIFADDGYRSISNDEAQNGDVVLYETRKGPAHVGVLWDRLDPLLKIPVVLSQWGLDGEYFHAIEDVNDEWRYRISIWTERLIHP